MYQLAYDMAEDEGNKGFSPVKKTAVRKWLMLFFKCKSELRIKNSQNLSISHAISANHGSINKFFENLRKWMADWKLEAEPNRIWNVDECGVRDIQNTKGEGITSEHSRLWQEKAYCDMCQRWWNDQTNSDTKGNQSTY